MSVFNAGLSSNLLSGASQYADQHNSIQQDSDSTFTGLTNPFLTTNVDGTFAHSQPSQSNSQVMDSMKTKYVQKRKVIQDQVVAIDTSKKLLAQYHKKLEEAKAQFKVIEANLVSLQDAEQVDGPLRSEDMNRLVATAPTIRNAQKKVEASIKSTTKDLRNTQDRISKEDTDLVVLQTEFTNYKKFIAEMGAPVETWESVQVGEVDDGDFDLLPPGNNPIPPARKMQVPKLSAAEKLNPESSTLPTFSDSNMDIQFSDGMYLPAFESKAHNQRTLNKMMQELEVRLKWPLTIETDRELYALAEFQAALAVTGNARLEQFAQKVREIKMVIEANKQYLDRLTIVQLELQLIPKASRQAIAITLQSLGRQPAYRKELAKPGHFETRKLLHQCIPNEVKVDPSENWKNPNKKISMAVAAAKGQGQGKKRPFDKTKANPKGPKNKPPKPVQTKNPALKPKLKQVPGPQESKKPKAMTCFNCQQTGHIKRNCPNPAVERPQK